MRETLFPFIHQAVFLQVVWLKICWAAYEVEYCIFENNNHIALCFGLVKGHLADTKQYFLIAVRDVYRLHRFLNATWEQIIMLKKCIKRH